MEVLRDPQVLIHPRVAHPLSKVVHREDQDPKIVALFKTPKCCN